MTAETPRVEQQQFKLLSPLGFTLLFAVFAVMYFQSLAGLSLSIDDDLAVLRADPSIWVQEGRWGAYLVERFLLPLPVVTFLPYALFGVGLCASFALIAASLEIYAVTWWVLLAFALFIGVPQWLFVMEFSANLVPIGLGFVCVSAAAFAFCKASDQALSPSRRLALAAPLIGLFCLAMSLYQPLLLAGLLLCSAVIMVRFARAEIDLIGTLQMQMAIAAAGLVAYLLCVAVNEIFFLLHPDLQRLTFYADRLFRPREAIRNIDGTFKAAMVAYKGVVWGTNGFYGTSVAAFGLATVAGSIALIVMALRNGAVRGLVVAAWLAAAWLTIVFFHLAAAGHPFVPYRSMVQLPALMAVLAIVGVSIRVTASRAVVLLLFAIAVLQESIVINRAAASHELVAARDTHIAGDLFRRIASVGRPGKDGLYKIETLGVSPGTPAYPMPRTSFVARSWFGHDPKSQSFRIANYMRLLGYPVRNAGRGAAAFSATWATMPSWPAEGSVVAADEITLVKLSGVPWL